MNISLENLLINKIEELTKFRQFYYEYMVFDRTNGHLLISGAKDFYISQHKALSVSSIQEVRSYLLSEIRKEDSYFLDFSDRNIVLGAIVEIEKPLEAKKGYEDDSRLSANFIDNLSEFFQANSKDDGIDFRKDSSDIFIRKIFDIYKQLMHNPMNGEREVLKNEIIESLHHLPQRIQQLSS